jgi:hypothetical protein
MISYFQKLGYTTAKRVSDLSDCDIIITRKELFSDVSILKKPTILIDTIDTNIIKPLCEHIVFSLSDKLDYKSIITTDFRPRLPRIEPSDLINSLPNNIIVYGNYVDSGWFRIFKHDIFILERTVKILKDTTNSYIVHVGSMRDKNNDHVRYPWIDIDIRGLTDPEQIIALFQSGKVSACVSFDTFVAHVSMLANIETHVRLKRSFKTKNNFIKRCVIPPFPVSSFTRNDLLKLL